MITKTSLAKDSVGKRDILLTNQYHCKGRIMVNKTSLEKTFFKSVRPFSNESVDTCFKVGEPWGCEEWATQ